MKKNTDFSRPDELSEGLIEGRNAVTEAIRSGRTINKVFLADGDTDKALGRLAAMAKEAGAVVVRIDRRKLNDMSPTNAHQGIIASVAAHEYATVDDILQSARERSENPLIVICDELSDPHNLGAIMRTAECAGAHGVIIPKRRSVGLTAVVSKASAGAIEYMPVARVSNIAAAIREKNGETTKYKPSEMAAAITALVIGGGGSGEDLVPNPITYSGDCSYLFHQGRNQWIQKTISTEYKLLTQQIYLMPFNIVGK